LLLVAAVVEVAEAEAEQVDILHQLQLLIMD
jgi:hypothetical protein